MTRPIDADRSPTHGAGVKALWLGILTSLAFTAMIAWAGPWLAAIPHLPDRGAGWYYWKLPRPTHWGHATAWGLYVLHQVASWSTIAYAQARVRRYTEGLHPINLVALGLNAGFVLAHFVQTHVWYDGLAQDVSIFSALASVAVMLIWVLLMENPGRGLFFGRPAPLGPGIIDAARRYHGYYFSWAVIYTFWFHPMEPTSSHLVGFFYTFLLLLQGSLFYTRVHTNRWWTLTLELLVVVHGTLVAWIQSGSSGFWPMFCFGFLGVFLITQMHGLGWARSARSARWAIVLAYFAAVVSIYSRRGWDRVGEVARIPIIDYVSVFVLAGLIALFSWIGRGIARQIRLPVDDDSADRATQPIGSSQASPPEPVLRQGVELGQQPVADLGACHPHEGDLAE